MFEASSLCRGVQSVCNNHSHEGGKNCAIRGQTLVFRAVFRAFGSLFHRRLIFSSNFPPTLLTSPLRTTLYHILAVSRLLSSRNFEVWGLQGQCPGKARCLVVYH